MSSYVSSHHPVTLKQRLVLKKFKISANESEVNALLTNDKQRISQFTLCWGRGCSGNKVMIIKLYILNFKAVRLCQLEVRRFFKKGIASH